MKANKVIRHLIEESIRQTEVTNTLMLQAEQRRERTADAFQRERGGYIQRLEVLKEKYEKALQMNEILGARLRAHGLDSTISDSDFSDVALAKLREKLTGGN